jgi:hypothetical protein
VREQHLLLSDTLAHARTQIQAFREALNDARSIASALPGGEMLIEEQEEVIALLERLRAKKRYVRLLLWSFVGEARGKREKGNENSSSPSGLIVFSFFLSADYSYATFRKR